MNLEDQIQMNVINISLHLLFGDISSILLSNENVLVVVVVLEENDGKQRDARAFLE